MKTNRKEAMAHFYTHEYGPGVKFDAAWELERAVMACMLWEDTFYEGGETIASRIKTLVAKNDPAVVADLAIRAREQMNLRHVPLFLCRELARLGRLKAETLTRVIQRADELAEFVAIYWKDKKQPLSKQVRKGLAAAFTKFNAYQLAKYDGDGAVKLRDVLFLVHAKPNSNEQGLVWKQLIDGKLAPPDTWEVQLSAGKDKRATWERLLATEKLGALALLRNLRNMEQVGVDRSLIRGALGGVDVSRVLPFRFIAAARYAPWLEPELEKAMFKSISAYPKLKGRTAVLVDISGSMDDALSAKSDMTRMDAACGLAMILRELCDDVAVYSFSDYIKMVPSRRGFALRDAIVGSQEHGSTNLDGAVNAVRAGYDRIVVITDEQAQQAVGGPGTATGYMINVASYQTGVGYGDWLRINGFSEAIVKYISAFESLVWPRFI